MISHLIVPMLLIQPSVSSTNLRAFFNCLLLSFALLLSVLFIGCGGVEVKSQFAHFSLYKEGFDPEKKSENVVKASTKEICLSSISWIPEEEGLPVYDPAPPVKIDPDACALDSVDSSYRFSNGLRVRAVFAEYQDRTDVSVFLVDNGKIGHTLHVPARHLSRSDDFKIEEIEDSKHGRGFRFRAFVCSQTKLPNPAGCKEGEKFWLPPIWTEHLLSIFQDGTIIENPCSDWSVFPQHYCYDHEGDLIKKNRPELNRWKQENKNPCLEE